MRSMVFVISVLVLALGAGAAQAKEMHCNCYKDFKDKIHGKTQDEYKFTCKKTFDKLGSRSTSDDYNGFVKIYFEEGKSNDKKLAVHIRPRKPGPECLVGVYNQDEKLMWGGSYCNNDKKKEFGGFNMKEMPDGSLQVGGMAQTLSKNNQFLGIYFKTPQDPNNNYLGAVCVEDK